MFASHLALRLWAVDMSIKAWVWDKHWKCIQVRIIADDSFCVLSSNREAFNAALPESGIETGDEHVEEAYGVAAEIPERYSIISCSLFR